MGSSQHPLSVVTLRDALGLAMELADEYAFVNAACLLDRGGEVLDLIVAEGIGRTIEPVVSWLTTLDSVNRLDGLDRSDRAAAGLPAALDQDLPARGQDPGPGPVGVVLLTVRPFDAEVIREEDIRHYRRAGWAVSCAGAHLIDWIETDGDLFRSYAYVTCPARAWAGDPPTERLVDGTAF